MLPVRDPESGVVASGLDHIASADGEAVTTRRCHYVIDLTGLDASRADTLVQRRRLIIRGNRDGFAVTGVLGYVFPGLLIVGVQSH